MDKRYRYGADMCQRRNFLKKAVYHTPVLYTLGSLIKPISLSADFSGGPPGPPGGFPFFSNSSDSKKTQKVPKKRKVLRF
jgi:hypothetical protein